MSLQSKVQRIKSLIRILREECAKYFRSHFRLVNLDLTDQENAYLANLQKDGFIIIKNYWVREKALQIRNRLEAYLAEGHNRDYDNGSYLRYWNHKSNDQGVCRLFHVELLEKELKYFRTDPFVLRIAAAYYGCPFYSEVLIYQHNTQWNVNPRYYHIDSFGKKFKAFLYLDDVDEGNGPFTYLKGSHLSWFPRLKKQIIGNPSGEKLTSFYESELKFLLKHEVKICGSAGTLILVDVNGLHRGSPQVKRSRSVLVNYLKDKPGNRYLGK